MIVDMVYFRLAGDLAVGPTSSRPTPPGRARTFWAKAFHLRLAGEHRFEEDIERNIAPHCVILERRGIFRGRDGARELARLLEEELGPAPYEYTLRLVDGRFAFLEWTADAILTPAMGPF